MKGSERPHKARGGDSGGGRVGSDGQNPTGPRSPLIRDYRRHHGRRLDRIADLPPEAFPVMIRAHRADTGAEVWAVQLGPGPGYDERAGLTNLLMIYGDGTVAYSLSHGLTA